MNQQQPRDPKRPQEPKDAKDNKFSSATNLGGLYDRHGPIPVPDAHESDTDSAWALFEETMMRQDNPEAAPEPNFEDTSRGSGNFEPTDFGDPAYDATRAAPLKP
jgi:hypothetical protein